MAEFTTDGKIRPSRPYQEDQGDGQGSFFTESQHDQKKRYSERWAQKQVHPRSVTVDELITGIAKARNDVQEWFRGQVHDFQDWTQENIVPDPPERSPRSERRTQMLLKSLGRGWTPEEAAEYRILEAHARRFSGTQVDMEVYEFIHERLEELAKKLGTMGKPPDAKDLGT